MFNLNGKKALVTGASGGIGKAITKILHQAGATIAISGTREHALKDLETELKDRTYPLVCNLGDKQQTNSLIDRAVEVLGGLDILICNAGVTKDNLAIRMKDEDFAEVIEVNLNSSFILNRNAIKVMMKNKWGRIINISSIVGVMGNFGQANYAASKAGLIGMSKSLAKESAARGITVNIIAPGFITTPMTENLKEEHKDKMKANIPSGEFGTPEDIAYTSLFLASEEAAYINGQTIHVNGGMLMV